MKSTVSALFSVLCLLYLTTTTVFAQSETTLTLGIEPLASATQSALAVTVDSFVTGGERTTNRVERKDGGLDLNRTNNVAAVDVWIVMPVRHWLPLIMR